VLGVVYVGVELHADNPRETIPSRRTRSPATQFRRLRGKPNNNTKASAVPPPIVQNIVMGRY
jgi:hypothetical protein